MGERVLSPSGIRLGLAAFALLLLCGSSFAFEWEYEDPPKLDGESSELYSRFWSEVGDARFREALLAAEAFSRSDADASHRKMVERSADLIGKHHREGDGDTLSRYLLLERKRISWQDHRWWPRTDILTRASAQVEKLIDDYGKLLVESELGGLTAHILLSLGLCYSDTGELGPRDKAKARNLLEMVVRDFPDSEAALHAEQLLWRLK
jgi:hypothetical protein